MKNIKLILISVFLFSLILLPACKKDPGKYDSFAQCLTESDVKMFGAYWCPHCADQKKEFSDSWNLVNYIECSLPNKGGQTAVCERAGIKSYPTWEFKDGTRKTGVFSLEDLSFFSGCPLPKSP